MAFLEELKTLKMNAIRDHAENETKKAIHAFSTLINTSLQTMKEGIYNEFRKQVISTPNYTQYTVKRTIYPTNDNELIGLCKVFSNKVGFSGFYCNFKGYTRI